MAAQLAKLQKDIHEQAKQQEREGAQSSDSDSSSSSSDHSEKKRKQKLKLELNRMKVPEPGNIKHVRRAMRHVFAKHMPFHWTWSKCSHAEKESMEGKIRASFCNGKKVSGDWLRALMQSSALHKRYHMREKIRKTLRDEWKGGDLEELEFHRTIPEGVLRQTLQEEARSVASDRVDSLKAYLNDILIDHDADDRRSLIENIREWEAVLKQIGPVSNL